MNFFPKDGDLKAALQGASPLLLAMSQGILSGRGAGAFMPQGIQMMQAQQEKSEEKAAKKAATEEFNRLLGIPSPVVASRRGQPGTAPAPQAPAGRMSPDAILALMGNEGLTQGQRQALSMKYAQATKPPRAPRQRRIVEDANGRKRYLDTGEFVFGDLEVQPQMTNAVQSLQQRAQLAGLVEGTPEYQSFILNNGAAQTPSANWVDLTPEELQARGMVTGQRDTVTGKVVGKQASTGTTFEVLPDGTSRVIMGGNQQPVDLAQIPGQDPVPPMEGARDSFTVGGGIENLVNRGGDAIGIGRIDPASSQTRTRISNANTSAMLLLSSEFPGRPSNLTREKIETMLPQPGFLSGPDTALDQTNEILNMIDLAIQGYESVLSDPRMRRGSEQAAVAAAALPNFYDLRGEYLALREGLRGIATPPAIDPAVAERLKAYE